MGKLLLLARRLCERGCGFVTVTTSFVWDMHADVNNATMTEGMDYVGILLTMRCPHSSTTSSHEVCATRYCWCVVERWGDRYQSQWWAGPFQGESRAINAIWRRPEGGPCDWELYQGWRGTCIGQSYDSRPAGHHYALAT